MLDDVKRFDMQRPPLRQHLLPIAWVLAAATLIPHKNKLKKMDMEGVKPPYLLLCNHRLFEAGMAPPARGLHLQAQVHPGPDPHSPA